MPRMARAVAPGYPHQITQRGNRRQKTFFNNGDFKLYPFGRQVGRRLAKQRPGPKPGNTELSCVSL